CPTVHLSSRPGIAGIPLDRDLIATTARQAFAKDVLHLFADTRTSSLAHHCSSSHERPVMASTLHSRLIPALSRGLATLTTYLDKIERAEKGNALAGNRYLWDRLAPNMQPFKAQIQMAADTAKGSVARLAGIAPPSYADTENNVAELRERLKKTDAFIHTVGASEFEGADERMIDQSFRRAPYAMRGDDYVDAFVLPNFYFHIATAHAILRAGGLDVGKVDYLGQLSGTALRQHEAPERVRFLTAQH